jgi:FkbM family methyltransferase
MAVNFKFCLSFLKLVAGAWYKMYADNVDKLRFPEIAEVTSLRSHVSERYQSIRRVITVLSNSRQLGWVYEKLSDDKSRDTLLAVIAFRALGHFRIKLPLNTKKYWSLVQKTDQELTIARNVEQAKVIGSLNEYDLSSCGFPVHIKAHPLNIINTFLLQQYLLPHEGKDIEVGPADVVIDAGGCWGDTALYFACKSGSEGAVYVYEFDPDNLKLFHKNMQLNPSLASHVHLQEHAVWKTAGEILRFTTNGPASRLVGEGEHADAQTSTDTIDQLVEREKVKKLDFIKMDIEGAELDALQGAEQAIRKFTPKLAISIYHRPEHFWQIPQYIASLNLGYEFFIEHFTIHAEETMLFAKVPGK